MGKSGFELTELHPGMEFWDCQFERKLVDCICLEGDGHGMEQCYDTSDEERWRENEKMNGSESIVKE